ncbi:MAG: hypothetical protein IAE82_03425, partial [Opitutaceae bacterium]|nr:hypothetical protein [Opitutaceae bacterium]
FGVDAEPQPPPINRYRVACVPISAESAVDLRFREATPAARILAIHLLPQSWKPTPLIRRFEDQLAAVGRHTSTASLDGLRFELEQRSREREMQAFSAYWVARLDLLSEAERWYRAGGWDWVSASTRSSMFTRYRIATALLDPLVDERQDPRWLRDRAMWQRARLLYWLHLEQEFPEDKAAYVADLDELHRRFPADPLIAMYAGEKIAAPTTGGAIAPLSSAPTWSTAELEALHHLRDIARYWTEERQAPNGELGGKTDDDVEMLRWWTLLLFTGDAKTLAGYRKLADCIWFSPRVHLGYSRVARDVEHSSEFVADTLPIMALITHDPEWIDRLRWSSEHMRTLWTGYNEHGDLHFKSAWIGATEILSDPPRNRDVAMNVRATKAVRYYARLADDRESRDALQAWSLAWAKVAARTDKAKPAGLFPASVRWPDAAFNGDEPTWYRANMFWDYYDWRGDGDLYHQLLSAWLTSGDERLLTPMRTTLAFLQNHSSSTAPQDPPEGSAAWAAARLHANPGFWSAVAQWRLETGDTQYDSLLRTCGPAYLRFRLSGDATSLAATINRTLLDVVRHNRPLMTSEVLFTDRVYVSSRHGTDDGTDLLAAMLTGCHAADGVAPYFHVLWEGIPESFTALVTDTGAGRVAADVFLHQTSASAITARFLRLPPGRYRLVVASATTRLLDRIETVTGPDHRVTVEVPGASLISLTIAPLATP